MNLDLRPQPSKGRDPTLASRIGDETTDGLGSDIHGPLDGGGKGWPAVAIDWTDEATGSRMQNRIDATRSAAKGASNGS